MTGTRNLILMISLLMSVTHGGFAQQIDVDSTTETDELQTYNQTVGEESKTETDELQTYNQTVGEESKKLDEEYRRAIQDLENVRHELVMRSRVWNDQLNEMLSRYMAIDHKAGQLEQSLRLNDNVNDKVALYGQAVQLWRQLIDEALQSYQKILNAEDVPKLPEQPRALLEKLSDQQRNDYMNLYQQVSQERADVIVARRKAFEQKVNKFFMVLSHVSSVRAEILGELEFSSLVFEWGADFFNDMMRELFAIPVRFAGILFARYLEIKSEWHGGVQGFWSIIKKVLTLLLLLLLPFLARRLTNFIRKSLDDYRQDLIRRKRYTLKSALKIALWIQRITPYVSWVCYVLILEWLNVYLRGTLYQELSVIIPLVQYVLLYKIFLLLVADLFKTVSRTVEIDRRHMQPLVERTAKIIGKFFFISLAIMHVTEFAVDQGLIYGLVKIVMQFLGVVVCAYALTSWHEFLGNAVQQAYSGRFGSWLARGCQGFWKILFCLPTLIFILLHFISTALWEWLSEWEFSKRLLAKLYRKKIESMGAQSVQPSVDQLPDDYKELFSIETLGDRATYVEANQEQFHQIVGEINSWLRESEDDQSLVIYGESGIGKTTMIERVKNEFKDLNLIQFEVPAKTYQVESLTELLYDQLGLEDESNIMKAILEFNKRVDQKTIIFVDDAHNLFLGKVGGFAALRKFIEIVNLNTENLFWCVVFNEYSWSYLKGVLGGSHYLRTEIRLDSWSDESIRHLIESFHAQSKYRLSYDKIILASSSSHSFDDALSYAEEQFFRLLWEESKGNPKVALHLWLSCLTYQGGGTLKVGLPERPRSMKLSTLDDTAWFVLSCLVNHENATRKEIAEAMNMDLWSVRYALKMALESKFITKVSGIRYRLGLQYQQDIIRQLKVKNFIYGLE